MRTSFLACAGLLVLGASCPAVASPQTASLVVPVTHDVWHYSNAFNGATREQAPPFVVPPTFPSDRRDAITMLIFRPAVPAGFPADFRITSAKVRVYDLAGANWQPTGATTSDGFPSRLEMYAAGFGPTYNEATWDGTQPFVGGDNFNKRTRDPFPRDLNDNSNVQENIATANAWSIGAPIGYTPGATSTPFAVDFVLDVSNPTIQTELKADLASGTSSWALSYTYEPSQQGTPGSTPNVITSEGVAANPGSVTPTLFLELEELNPSSTMPSWSLYE